MRISPLELGLAVLALVVLFGPKRLPGRQDDTVKAPVDLRSLAPSQPAAGRAPSPLSEQHNRPQPNRRYVMDGVGLQPTAVKDPWGGTR
ncbi:MAG: hypothetical protein ACRDKI_00765 [Solirubrobacterales bacterium]